MCVHMRNVCVCVCVKNGWEIIKAKDIHQKGKRETEDRDV